MKAIYGFAQDVAYRKAKVKKWPRAIVAMIKKLIFAPKWF